MMNVILNCSVDDSAVPALARKRPLGLAPFLGATVLEHALAGLAAQGVKRVCLEVSDHAEEFRRVVGRGEAWGLELAIVTETAVPENFSQARALTLDTLPQLPERPLWRSYLDWYGAQLTLLPVLAAQRVGMREIEGGVFVGLRSQVAPDARLIGPCWIGANVFIGPRAVVGPGTVIEDGCYVDTGAEISGSIIGPQNYIGAFTEIRDSFAWGNELLRLETGSLTVVADRFLLGEVQRPKRHFNLLSPLKKFRQSAPPTRPRLLINTGVDPGASADENSQAVSTALARPPAPGKRFKPFSLWRSCHTWLNPGVNERLRLCFGSVGESSSASGTAKLTCKPLSS